MKEKIDNAAYEIVCKLIDCGLVESEPEGIDWEHTISEIIKKHLVGSEIKAPDKLYCMHRLDGNYSCSTTPYGGSVEYIRKDIVDMI